MLLDYNVEYKEVENDEKKLVLLASGIMYNRLKNLKNIDEINKFLELHKIYLKFISTYCSSNKC